MAEEKTKLEAFLTEKKIDSRRLLATSKRLETLRPEDRATRLKKAQARRTEGAPKVEAPKGRSGRPVSPRALSAAFAGQPVTGPVKTRILNAVNHLLAQKKAEAVDLRALF